MPEYWNGLSEINVLTPLPPDIITLNLQSLLWLVVPFHIAIGPDFQPEGQC